MSGTKSFVVVFVLLAGLLLLYSPIESAPAQIDKVKAPAFALKLLDGGELKSTELQGKVAVLKFKASW